MRRPDHLDSAPIQTRIVLARKLAAIVALALGALTFLIVAISQPHLWATPDPRITVPGFTATLIAAIFSWGRRENAYPLWLAGLGLAGAALVLGWFLMLAIVIGATVIVIAILHAVL